MEIATATSDDIMPLSALLREGDALHQPFDQRGLVQGKPHPASRDWLVACLADPEQLVLVARSAGQVRAMLRARLWHRVASRLHAALNIATVEELVVTAASRRSGIGRALMDRAEAWARQGGAERMQLSLYAANTAATDFYSDLGFSDLTRTLFKQL